MKKLFIILFSVLLFFTLVRVSINVNNEALRINDFLTKISTYDFSFSNTYQNFQVIGMLSTELPSLDLIQVDPPDSALAVVPWLGEFFVELWDFLISFFYFIGEIFLIIGRAIATVFFVLVDISKDVMNVLDILAYLCGFTTPAPPSPPGGGSIETTYGGGAGHRGGRIIESTLSEFFRGRGIG